MSQRETVNKPYTPLTGRSCTCRPGIERDNCPLCEGTGKAIDFPAIHRRNNPQGPTPGDDSYEVSYVTRDSAGSAREATRLGSYATRIRERLGEAKVAELLAHLPKGSLIWSYDVHTTRNGTTFYGLRVFSKSFRDLTVPMVQLLAADYASGAPINADRTYYLGKDVAQALGATFKQAQYWQGWHGDLDPARAVALLGEVLYGTPDAFSHRGIA